MNRKVLFVGFGNPGRCDDGLGPALAQTVEELAIPGVKVESSYQLSVEDAADAAEAQVVVFADASYDAPEPFSFTEIESRVDSSFTTHHVSPASIIGLAETLFQKSPKGYMLSIRGYDFDEFGEYLSEGAQRNLQAAAAFVERILPDLTSGCFAGCECNGVNS